MIFTEIFTVNSLADNIILRIEEVEMLPKIKYFMPILCLFMLFAYCSSAWAEDMQAIKQRMLQRKPSIDILKNDGAIGEGVDGYLHVRQAAGNAASIVSAENADRRKVNQMIAQREGTSVEQVSKQVATTIINNSPKGHWIQKPDGSWHQK